MYTSKMMMPLQKDFPHIVRGLEPTDRALWSGARYTRRRVVPSAKGNGWRARIRGGYVGVNELEN